MRYLSIFCSSQRLVRGRPLISHCCCLLFILSTSPFSTTSTPPPFPARPFSSQPHPTPPIPMNVSSLVKQEGPVVFWVAGGNQSEPPLPGPVLCRQEVFPCSHANSSKTTLPSTPCLTPRAFGLVSYVSCPISRVLVKTPFQRPSFCAEWQWGTDRRPLPQVP